jgi:predicted lipoprotein with Yx(FWY)xxD motif
MVSEDHPRAPRRGAATALAAGLLALVAGTTAACRPKSHGVPPDGGEQSPAAVTVMLANGPIGPYLTDGDGISLYLYAPDPPGKSTCYDESQCAEFWPPLEGTPTAGSGLSAGLLTTTVRRDGTVQVVYHGHPLYYYKGDTEAGQITGQGVNANGGLWYLVDPAGNAITAMPAPSPSRS